VTLREEKKRLRALLRERVAALAEEELLEGDRRIFERLLALPEYKDAQTVMAYFSIGREVDTHRAMEHALDSGKRVALPFVTGRGTMEARQIASLSDLVPGTYDIPAPAGDSAAIPPHEIDLILVPAAAFDRAGFRLGHGAGFYDRYLAACPAFSVGLAREKLVLDRVPREEHDRAVDLLVTEKKIARLV
jgi:5-formyltetrahydrofolate cyclo-ligase